MERMAVRWLLRRSTTEPNESFGLELPRPWVSLGGSIAHQCGEGIDPILVFLSKTKAKQSRTKGLQRKLNLTQGITVPSDGRSGGLVLMWKEGAEVCFKSYSNSHVDVVVSEGKEAQPWRATGFYGHPDAGMRSLSWNLTKSLNRQCDMPWVIFGDFNEIVHPDEKLGWLDRDARQMKGFRECVSECGLVDLGFVRRHYT